MLWQKLRGLEALRYISLELTSKLTIAMFQQLPQKLMEAGVEVLVIDTGHRFLELVPMSLRMPYIQVCNILQATTPERLLLISSVGRMTLLRKRT